MRLHYSDLWLINSPKQLVPSHFFASKGRLMNFKQVYTVRFKESRLRLLYANGKLKSANLFIIISHSMCLLILIFVIVKYYIKCVNYISQITYLTIIGDFFLNENVAMHFGSKRYSEICMSIYTQKHMV